jgi:hypothetical protein
MGSLSGYAKKHTKAIASVTEKSVALVALPRYISGNLQTIKWLAGYLGFIGNHSGVFCSGLGQTFCTSSPRIVV